MDLSGAGARQLNYQELGPGREVIILKRREGPQCPRLQRKQGPRSSVYSRLRALTGHTALTAPERG